MVLGLNVKSEQLWDILSIAHLQSANSTHSAVINQLTEKIEVLENANATHSAVMTQLAEKIEVLENYHGKFNCV